MYKLRFRIWDGFHLNYEGMMIPIAGVHNPKLIIQQNTGILDAKKHEIFEGDIVQIIIDETKKEVVRVQRNTENGQLQFFPQEWNTYMAHSYAEKLLIIGNIYENENPMFWEDEK